jgi:hypothetical protein
VEQHIQIIWPPHVLETMFVILIAALVALIGTMK